MESVNDIESQSQPLVNYVWPFSHQSTRNKIHRDSDEDEKKALLKEKRELDPTKEYFPGSAAALFKASLKTECDKTYDTRIQPRFHEANRSFSEKFFSCCAIRQTLDLSRNEIRNYYTFRSLMVKKYDEKNAEHESMLRALFELVFPPGSSQR